MADSRNDFWLAEFTINGESHHLMVMQGCAKKSGIEKAFVRISNAYEGQHPNMKMALVSLERVESPEQVDRRKLELKAAYPLQRFADELYPTNPNRFLFQPLSGSSSAIASGRAEEELIRFLCGG